MPRSNFQLLALSMGGVDGGKKQVSGDGEVDDLEVHLLQITEEVTFTTLDAIDKDGNPVDMVTVNGLDSVKSPAVVGCPDIHDGGYIKTIEISAGELLRHSLTDTSRGLGN